MVKKLILPFPGTEQTTLALAGGKALSLIRMAAAGLPVPPGAVLTTKLFQPWFDEIRASEPWAAFAHATPDQWKDLCPELKRLCPALPLTANQQQAFAQLRDDLAATGDALFAVRSSSPDEDLDTASFAGGYETRLGVEAQGLEEAVRHCFASSLDERVFVYKKERGFDALSPGIAVVVQRQVASDVAGVAFSLNPLTNDYDEAVIDANWGLGESVVAGLASPDQFVVDKVSGQVVEEKPGAKQTSIWLSAEGGTGERRDHRSAERTLDDTRIGELTRMLCRIEALYEKPIDVEWAYAGGELFVLQARPITAYVPLPPEMVTRPGERRLLYTDLALSSGLTINAPISPLGLDWMEEGVVSMVEMFVGKLELDLTFEQKWWFFTGGRMYQNLSSLLWIVSPETLAKSSTESDALMAATLANVDAERYRTVAKPPWSSLRMLRLAPRLLWRLRGLLGRTAWALLAPERARRACQHSVDAFEERFPAEVDYGLALDEFRRRYSQPVLRHLFGVTMSALAAGLTGLALVDRVAGKSAEAKALGAKLKLGFEGNVVVEMGKAMYRLARRLGPSAFEDLSRLEQRLEERRMPAELLEEWDTFMTVYGCRGPLEMDLASPRYSDAPGLVLKQMSFMAGDEEMDPAAAHRRLVEERRQAYEELSRRSGWPRRLVLRRVHLLIELFAGTRDTPKHHNLMLYHAVRRRAVMEGGRLVREGRLDRDEHVFDLTFADLEAAAGDPSLDLRRLREQRTRFLKVLAAQVRDFPGVIDSRGRILRPAPREEKPGELRGTAISPGVASGPVKVLRDPREKPVEKGDVLVAYATDPGWTPLFANASAIVLEIGGVLQHGAVVAREYGKPCVAGIDRLTRRLEDGQHVEVDGTTGVVRVIGS